ncbi:MAG: hypothetical protein QME44_07385 [Thermodesulfobacteriota bacterium]|nr:hypothetical protein [Thermodesulfobacteriota bacterium]
MDKKGSRPGMNFQQQIAVVAMDVALLVELCISMYFAQKNPENFTAVFFKCFLIMVIPTLILARIVIKRLRSREPEIETSS